MVRQIHHFSLENSRNIEEIKREMGTARGAGRNQPLDVGLGKIFSTWFSTKWKALVDME